MNNTLHEFPAAVLSATNLTLLSVAIRTTPQPLFLCVCFTVTMVSTAT